MLLTSRGNPTYLNVSRPENKSVSCLLATGQKLQLWNFSPYFKNVYVSILRFLVELCCETLNSNARDEEHLPTVCIFVPLSTPLQTWMSVKRLDVAKLPGPQFKGKLHVNTNAIKGVRSAKG